MDPPGFVPGTSSMLRIRATKYTKDPWVAVTLSNCNAHLIMKMMMMMMMMIMTMCSQVLGGYV